MLLALALLSALGTTPAIDSIGGTWQITGDVVGNPLRELCALKQSGTALTGRCTNDRGEAHDVTGEVKDGKITFKHAGEYEGQALTITYSATLTAAKDFKGTIDVQPFGATGSFAAVPAPAKP